MSGQNGKGAVELLDEHGAGQFVGIRERGKGKFLGGPAAQSLGKPFGITAQKNDFARAAIARFAEPLCKLIGGLVFSTGVQQDDRRRGIELQFAERCGGVFAQFAELHFGESPDARDVIVDDCANFRTARFSEHDDADFHGHSDGV
jgi:hypothetical protein